MINSIRAAVTCRWSARRIGRYLDADPSAILSARDVARLEGHLEVCARCSSALGEFRFLDRLLGSMTPTVDADSLSRMRGYLDRVEQTSGGDGRV